MSEEIIGDLGGVRFDRHVSYEEAKEAQDPNVGDGTIVTAPFVTTEEIDMAATKTRMSTKTPSPKLIADFGISAISFILTFLVLDLDPEASAAISKVLGFLAAYFAPVGETEEVETDA